MFRLITTSLILAGLLLIYSGQLATAGCTTIIAPNGDVTICCKTGTIIHCA